MHLGIPLPAVRVDNTSLTFIPVPGTRVQFTVDEPLMLVELVFDAVYDHSQASGEVHLTWYIDGVDEALPYTDGLHSNGRTAANTPHSDYLSVRKVVERGSHTAEVYWKTNNGAGTGASLRADLWPAEVLVELRSLPGTLAQGTNSKVQGVF